MATKKQTQAWQAYFDSRTRLLAAQPGPDPDEAPPVRQARIARLRAGFDGFCHYYFPHYTRAPFGWFHRRAVELVLADPQIKFVGEWPRGHAKSVLFGVLLPLFLKSRGELTGMILTGQNQRKAFTLLLDLQAELEANEKYIADYGPQHTLGDWEAGAFATRDGLGFWAFGRGQSPRGTRKGANRPNYIVADDLDDKEIVRNTDRVQDVVDWVNEDLLGCFGAEGGRLIVVGNRIHRQSILAHLAGDVEEGQPVKPTVTHLKVYALENPRTHAEDQSEGGVPAWKEYFSRSMILDRMAKMGHRSSQREFFHKHIIEGRIFRADWMRYAPMPDYSVYSHIVCYNDPSYKDTKKNDFKAILALGKLGRYYHLLDCWVAQDTTARMVSAHYDLDERLRRGGARLIEHYIEANLMQDVHLLEYVAHAETRGWMLMIRPDKRQKPDKFGRIENLTPLWERELVQFNEALAGNVHFVQFLDQLLGFPNAHDDAPDAFEGAVWILNQRAASLAPISFGEPRRRNRL